MRRTLFDILDQRQFDIVKEYDRIYTLFYLDQQIGYYNRMQPLAGYISDKYRLLPSYLIHRTISLDDFENEYKCQFYEPGYWPYQKKDENVRLNDFLLLCEYTYNFTKAIEPHVQKLCRESNSNKGINHVAMFLRNIESCVDELGCKIIVKNNIYIIVSTTPQVLAIAEIVEPELGTAIFEYNHFRLKGQLAEKLQILKLLADDLEPQRKELNSINNSLSNNLFQMFQFFVRHNHTGDEKYKQLSDDEIEAWYDDIYQMYLLAKLELDQVERNKRVKEFLAIPNNSTN